MSEMSLSSACIRSGVWQAVLTGPEAAPEIAVWHQEQQLDGVQIAPAEAPQSWQVSVPIPAELLSDGVQTFLVTTGDGTRTLGSFAIVTGVPFENDLRAELDLLRAELDLLKRAFRRHALGGGDAQTAD